jgi:endonuclease III
MTAPKRKQPPARKPAAAARPAKQKPAPPARAAAKPAAKPATKPAAKPSVAKPAAAKPVASKPVAAKPVPAPPAEKPPARGVLVPKLFKALRANFKPVPANTSRPLLDQVLFACCLENARPEVAEKAFERLVQRAFDLNEIRVTTVAELAETLHDLPEPPRAALSLRRALQAVFESTYSFSLEHARKHSLAHGVKTLEGLHGVPPFAVQYVVSTGLGGHMIPLDKAALTGLFLTGIITQQEYDSGKVVGLERVVPKKVAVEFASLLHQFGIECLTNLHGATVRRILQTVNPAAKDRLPKRGLPLPEPVPPPPAAGREGQRAADAARAAAEEHRPAGPQAASRPVGKTPLPPAGSGPKRPADGKSGPKPFVVKPNVGKPITIKPPVQAAPEKPPAKPEPKGKNAAAGQHAEQLVKRKPR